MLGVRRSPVVGLRLSLVWAAMVFAWAAPVAAMDVPLAERLFTEALGFMKADHCEDALPRFIESQRLDPAAATLTNIATCYARVGKTASAYRAYREAMHAAIIEHKPELEQRTKQALAALAPTVTRLKIVAMGNGALPEIRVNGELVPDAREPVPLDPGDNLIEARAPNRDPWRRTVQSPGEGTLIVVEVPELSPPPERKALDLPTAIAIPERKAVEASPARQSAPEPARTARTNFLPYTIVAAGVGATALTVGAVLAYGAHARSEDAKDYCSGNLCLQEGTELRDDAALRAELAGWSFGIGVASLVTATIFWTQLPTEPQRAGLAPTVQLGPRSAFVGLGGPL